jgi:hypothetical protein
VNDALATATIIASLGVALFCLVACLRDRWLGVIHMAAVALLELALLAQTTIVAVRIASGDRPSEFVTFLGYLVTSTLFIPLCLGLAWMERTRWGSAIVAGGCAVAAVLTLRLQQVWNV